MNGEIVCITGAGNGIGALIAKKLADKGCVIVALDVNIKGNDETVEEIRFETHQKLIKIVLEKTAEKHTPSNAT